MLIKQGILSLVTAGLIGAQTGSDNGSPEIATFQWDCAQLQGACDNACFHVRCRGLQNVLPLTMDTNFVNRPKRRQASGCALKPCFQLPALAASGDSCHDFPFAFTEEGGTGATMRCVPFAENSNQGDQLGSFRQGLRDGQKFDISLINYQNSPFCLPTTDCQNDGFEFVLQDGIFHYATSVPQQLQDLQARDGVERMQMNSKSYFFRRYIGADGVERLHLPARRDESLVGRSVVTQDGEVAMIREIA